MLLVVSARHENTPETRPRLCYVGDFFFSCGFVAVLVGVELLSSRSKNCRVGGKMSCFHNLQSYKNGDGGIARYSSHLPFLFRTEENMYAASRESRFAS